MVRRLSRKALSALGQQMHVAGTEGHQHRRAAGALLPVDVRTCTDGGDFVYQARAPLP